jgi:predicted metal-dependent phosphoesterase TrpH
LRQTSSGPPDDGFGGPFEVTGVLKVDLHIHTGEDPVDRISHTAADLVDRAVTLGFDALAITLHESQFSDARVFDYARERGVVLIPGVERTIEGKHVLLLNFPNADVESARTLDDVAKLKSRTNGLVIAPHAFFPDRSCLRSRLDAHADLFDAVEWSYFWTRAVNFNARAERWAREHGKPVVGNSDLHDLRQLGRTYSAIDAALDPAAICSAIRDGRVVHHTEPVPVLELTDVFARMMLRTRKQPIMNHDVRTARRAVARPGAVA